TVYLCSDGVVRDLTLSYSSYRPSSLFERAVLMIKETLDELVPRSVTIYLDSPIPRSGLIARRIRELTGGIEVKTSKRVDSDVLAHEVVASSDSRIIGVAGAVVDLAHATLSRMGVTPKRLFTDKGILKGLLDDRST
ncbi:MAG: DUF5616 domain-containing protein, partial [Candidatus Korarchaeum sp.]|nr:DUF5616 domain-containing protein [Candidatus Korarchaeum sp.]MDW8036343.1 DUF5616 domain-containing protein [Candidatus Korarchaeum sp.]